MCNICFDEIETNEIIKTKCNHCYHYNCLNKIIFPKCPTCRTDITVDMKTYFGITKKQILNNVNREEFRLMITNFNEYINYEITELTSICLYSIKLLKNNFIDLFVNIASIYFENDSDKFIELSKLYDNDGVFLYYCNTTDFIDNFLRNYKTNVSKWMPYNKFDNNKKLTVFLKGLYNKINENNFGVLFVFENPSNNKLYIQQKIFYKKEITQKLYPSKINMIKHICENEILKNTENKKNVEYEYNYNFYINNYKLNTVIYYKNYKDIKDFISNDYHFNNAKSKKYKFGFLEFFDDLLTTTITYLMNEENDVYNFIIIENNHDITLSKVNNYIKRKFTNINSYYIKITLINETNPINRKILCYNVINNHSYLTVNKINFYNYELLHNSLTKTHKKKLDFYTKYF